jgi:acyl-CoA synthetase (AMP-forming)/AMP-acid ligase II
LGSGTLAILSKWDVNLALRIIPKFVNFSLLFTFLTPLYPYADKSFYSYRYKISFLPLIPSVVHQLINHPGIEKADFSSVSIIASGAAYLPLEMCQKLLSLAPNSASFFEG